MSDEKERYQKYLCSREWAVLRTQVFARCGNICERCENGPAKHAHHLTYIRKYNERLEDLEGLCEPCHSYNHDKIGRDPRLDAPVRLWGKPIGGVYLAGKITNDHWRETSGILPVGFSMAAHDEQDWLLRSAISVPGKLRKLDYHGPFHLGAVETHAGDFLPNEGAHAFGNAEHDGHGGILFSTGVAFVRDRCFQGVWGSDLIFAWIDSRDCFGTIAEIAFAYALKTQRKDRKPLIVIATPSRSILHDMWFVAGLSDHIISAASPAEAWSSLWASPAGRPYWHEVQRAPVYDEPDKPIQNDEEDYYENNPCVCCGDTLMFETNGLCLKCQDLHKPAESSDEGAPK